MGPHRTKRTWSRIGGESIATNDALTLYKVGEGSKEKISLEGADLIL